MTEAKLQKEDTCPECQLDDIDWVESYVEWSGDKEYNVSKGICKTCDAKFKKWCSVLYSFTQWD